jgi:KDO2-lipid IV(A) lauroyltransferase
MTWSSVKVFMILLQTVPESVLPRFGQLIGNAILRILPQRKDIALNNLEIALGDILDKEERENILKRSISEVVLGSAEILKYLSLPPEKLLSRIDVQGREYIDQALEQGQGVICFGGHFGNFVLMLIALAKLGYPIFVITRDPKNKRILHLFNKIKKQVEIEFIPDKPKNICLRRALHCLRENNVLFLQIDLNVISGGVMVEFFGHLVPTYAGPVILSLRTSAPILPLFIYRKDTFYHKIVAGPPLPLEITGNKERDLVNNLSRLTKVIEDYIRQEPTAWWWLHRRWRKAKPLS